MIHIIVQFVEAALLYGSFGFLSAGFLSAVISFFDYIRNKYVDKAPKF